MMKRCPSCRTLCDADQDVRCFACGGELSKQGPPAPLRVPEVLKTARTDRRNMSGLLSVFGLFGVIGVFFIAVDSDIDLPIRIGLGLFLLVSVVLGILSLAGGQ